MKKILVVGGVAGGASFAARMRRLDESAEIIMFEKGEYISFANCGLPYHIGGAIKNRDNLIIQTPEKFKTRFNVDVRTRSEVISIDTAKKSVQIKSDGNSYEESYDYLVLSPGAGPIRPPIKGIESKHIHSLRNIPDMDLIKNELETKTITRAAVIGGGFIGLEMAENLRQRGLEVTLIEMADQVFAPADREMAQILHQHLELNSVRLMLNTGAESFEDKSDGTVDINFKDGNKLNVDILILAIGVKPDTGFIKEAGIKVNERGAIIVDDHLRTSSADVYAVGDAIEVTDFVSGNKVHVPLAGPANRQARIVADNIIGRNSMYKNTQGTAICKIFDLSAAVSGLSEKSAKRYGIEYVKSYTHSASSAGYYPGSFPLSIKILFSPKDGKLLGAQVIGKVGVDKRIDIFATAIRHGLTVYDLSELELSYAPPYGSAKDAVNLAGFTAENILNGTAKIWYPENFEKGLKDGCTILDVRTKDEFNMGALPEAVLIPVDELRSRLGELRKDRPVMVYCQVGLRGYIASRILEQNGFDARNLSGGYKTFVSYEKTGHEIEYINPLVQPVCSSPSGVQTPENIIKIDACGLQCPGPILRLKTAIDNAQNGELIEIRATEMGFAADISSWCSRTKNSLVSLNNDKGTFVAIIRKGAASDVCVVPSERIDKKTMVIFSNDFDKLMAAFIIANGAAATGCEVTMFFTFWGLNLLRRSERIKVKKNIVEKMFGMMMPRGATRTTLSKMHMGGIGTFMIRQVMKNKNVYSLSTLIEEARKTNIRFVACSMSMDIMGIKKEELIDGVEIGGVASYLEKADEAGYNLFI